MEKFYFTKITTVIPLVYKSKNISVDIYPNPAYNQTNIEIHSNNYNLSSYKTLIYNVNGELVKEIISTSYINTFSVDSFESGVYIYKILIDNGINLTGKFIVY